MTHPMYYRQRMLSLCAVLLEDAKRADDRMFEFDREGVFHTRSLSSMNYVDLYNAMVEILDIMDEDDMFGSNGWRESLGFYERLPMTEEGSN